MADPWPMRIKFLSVHVALVSLLLLLSGCTALSDFFRQRPQALPPAQELYAEGESQLSKSRYEEARAAFRKVAERHPQSTYAPRARFLIGEAYYREGQFDKAIKEFESFMAFYPRHEIADLVHGDTVRDALAYVQFDAEALVANFRRKVARATDLSRTEANAFIADYIAGLAGYTYLEGAVR